MSSSLLVIRGIRLILAFIVTYTYVSYLGETNLPLAYFVFALIPIWIFLMYLWKGSKIAKYFYIIVLCNILITTTNILLTVYTILTPAWDVPSPVYIEIFLSLIFALYAIYLSLRVIPAPRKILGADFIAQIRSKVDRVYGSLMDHGSRIFFAWLLFTVLFLSWRYGIFSQGIIISNDHPYHYYQVWYTAKYLIPVFHNAIGWSPHFYAGFPIMYHYHPGSYLIISLLHLGSLGIISIGLAYRILFVLTLFATPLSTYFFAKELRLSEINSTIIGLLSVVPTFRYIEMLYWGMTADILATGMSPLVFALLHRYFKTKQISSLLTASLIFGVIVLIHSIVAIGVALGIILYLILEKHIKIHIILPLLAIPILLSAFWTIPSAYYYFRGYWGVQTLLPFAIVKTLLGFINYHLYLLFGIPIVLLPFIYIGYKQFYRDKNVMIRFILFYPILLYIISFYGSAIPKLQELQLLHLMPYLGLYIVIIAGLGISVTLKRNRYRGIAVFALLIVIISPILGTMPFSLSMSMNSIMNEKSILSIGLPNEVTGVFNWVKENSDARVLLEDSDPLRTGAPWGLGYNLALAPVYAENVKFIGGPLSYYNPSWTGNRTMTKEGVFFGMSLEGINYQMFIRRLDEFNIQHIVVWSNKSKHFLSKSDDFKLVKEINHFSIYEYENAPKSFVIRTTGDVRVNVTNFGAKTINLWIKANETSKITLSSSYFPNWHAYVGRKEIPVYMDDMFSQIIVLPEDTPYEVLLVFEEGSIEKYSKWLSLFAWIGVLILILLYSKKE